MLIKYFCSEETIYLLIIFPKCDLYKRSYVITQAFETSLKFNHIHWLISNFQLIRCRSLRLVLYAKLFLFFLNSGPNILFCCWYVDECKHVDFGVIREFYITENSKCNKIIWKGTFVLNVLLVFVNVFILDLVELKILE